MAENQDATPTLLHLGAGGGSKVERIKESSEHLRGHIVEELQQESTRFSDEQVQLLKFHGTYQQEDRDLRQARKAAGEEKAYQFMVRSRIPGGVLTPEQYLAEDELAGRYANGTLRFTTRQGIQLHGVLKGDLHATIQRINETLLSTLAACGDVNRNVMACPAPTASRARARVHEIAHTIAMHLAPRSHAYHEIWIDGEQVATIQRDEVEPIYGPSYLPRKFKIGIAFPGDNCIDVYTQDIGLVAHVDGDPGAADEQLAGFTVLVGGGMGMTHGKAETYPHLALPLCFVTAAEVVEVVETIVTIQRDYGDRQNRKHARMKYVVAERGVAWLRAELERRLGRGVREPRPLAWREVEDHLGWHSQGDGRCFLGLYVENGRVKDTERQHLRTGLREVIAEFRPGIHLSAQQNILLTDISAEQRPLLDARLATYGIPTDPTHLGLRRLALACPALPTCGLALAEAERVFPAVLGQIERELCALGLENELVSIRMTGCPNGCARPYMGDIGIVGRSKDVYNVYIGGDQANTRLNTLYASLVHLNDLAATVRPLLELWRAGRRAGETFGDFVARVGVEELRALVAHAGVVLPRVSGRGDRDRRTLRERGSDVPGYYPVMLDIRRRPVTVIGGDRVAAEKAAMLAASGAHVSVISPQAGAQMQELAARGLVALRQKAYEPGDLAGAFLVVAATPDQTLIETIWQETQERGQPVNIVDVPRYCSFILPSILRRGRLTIAVSTEGASPAVARGIRQQLEEHFSPAYEAYIELAALARTHLRCQGVGYEARDAFFQHFLASPLLTLLEAGELGQAVEVLAELLHTSGVEVPEADLTRAFAEGERHAC